MKNAAQLVANKLPKLAASLRALSKRDVLVGVPSDDATRQDTDGPNNAMLAYVHDNGSPAQNIPARPFMRPGIENAKEGIQRNFASAAKSALSGQLDDKPLHRAGLIAQASIRNVINAGIAPALKPGTLKGRIRNRVSVEAAESELASRAAGESPSITTATPLVATGQLRNSINYVVRGN